MQIIKHGFHNDQTLKEVRLNSAELSVSLLNFGAVTRDLRYRVGDQYRPIVLSLADPLDYIENPDYLGVIAGRVAGRIGSAGFDLEEETHVLTANEGENQLHGGPGGLSHQFWELDAIDEVTARLVHVSPNGANGFPGSAVVTLLVSLSENAITYELTAEVDRPTPISLAQHSYYNLAGGGEAIWNHRMQVAANSFLVLDEGNVPNGEISKVDGTRYDLRAAVKLGELDPEHKGSDINLCFSELRDLAQPVAHLRAPDGLTMWVHSDQPGAQIYTAAGMEKRPGAIDGQALGPGMGICIEPQGYPNAVNHAHFPPIIATPEQPYSQILKLEFGWS